MKAILLAKPATLVEGDIEAPTCGPDDVLVAPSACGVCGGDIKLFKGIVGKAYPHFIGGHELAGRVVAAGKNVQGIREGDLVARCFQSYCGWCRNCRLGRPNFCLESRSFRGGGFAALAVDSANGHGRAMFKVPDGISAVEAALAEPITCAIGAVLKAAPKAGERVAVIGLGGMGQLISQILVSMHAYVIGIDQQPDKLASARAICAEVIDAAQQDVVSEVFRLTGGAGADLVMEAVGIPATLRQALEFPRMGGRVVIVGAFTETVDGVNVDRIFRRDLTIQAAKGPFPHVAPNGVPLALRYIEEGIVRPKELLTTFPFDQAQAAFDAQAYGGVVKSVVVQDEAAL
jgi:threonine dehydrogenase-like Zn-dependent dehydrogenase